MLEALKNALVARGTQLLARYLATALVGLAGYSAAQADAAGWAVAAAAVALLLALADHLIHGTRLGALVAARAAALARTFGAAGIVLLLATLPLAGGCRASRPFVEGVTRAVPLLDRDVRAHAGDDAVKLAQAEGLQASVRDPATIDAESVDTAWSPVRDWYLPAVDANGRLAEPEKAIRRSAAYRLDKLIADERRRPLRLGSP